MAIEIDFLANVSKFLRGTKDAEDALGDVAGSLDDVARDSQRNSDRMADSFEDAARDIDRSNTQLGRSFAELGDEAKRETGSASKSMEGDFKDAARDVEQSNERLERSFAELGDEAKRETGSASKSMEGDFKDAARDVEQSNERLERSFAELADAAKRETTSASKTMESGFNRGQAAARGNIDEFKQEATANLAETLSSFDGTVEGFLSGVQGTLGGVTAGLTGVVPIIAAAAGAAGLGLIMTAFQAGGEQAERMREKVSKLADEFIETGEIGETSLDFIIDGLKEMATSTDENVTNLAKLQKQSSNTASGFEKISQAYAGNLKGLDELIAAEEERLDLIRETTQSGRRAADQSFTDNTIMVNNQQKVIDGLKEAKTVAEEAALADAAYASSGAAELEAKAARILTINDAYDETAAGAEDYISAETGIFDTAAYIASMIAREEALINYQETLAKTALTPEAKAFIDSQGADAAAAFLSGYVAATPEQQAELNRIWTEAASQNSGTYRDKVQSDFTGGAHVRGPVVDLDMPDTNAYLGRIQSNLNGTVLRVRARVVDKNGRDVD